jgi:uncharacterized protein YjbI with pentapeptide repeats
MPPLTRQTQVEEYLNGTHSAGDKAKCILKDVLDKIKNVAPEKLNEEISLIVYRSLPYIHANISGPPPPKNDILNHAGWSSIFIDSVKFFIEYAWKLSFFFQSKNDNSAIRPDNLNSVTADDYKNLLIALSNNIKEINDEILARNENKNNPPTLIRPSLHDSVITYSRSDVDQPLRFAYFDLSNIEFKGLTITDTDSLTFYRANLVGCSFTGGTLEGAVLNKVAALEGKDKIKADPYNSFPFADVKFLSSGLNFEHLAGKSPMEKADLILRSALRGEEKEKLIILMSSIETDPTGLPPKTIDEILINPAQCRRFINSMKFFGEYAWKRSPFFKQQSCHPDAVSPMPGVDEERYKNYVLDMYSTEINKINSLIKEKYKNSVGQPFNLIRPQLEFGTINYGPTGELPTLNFNYFTLKEIDFRQLPINSQGQFTQATLRGCLPKENIAKLATKGANIELAPYAAP